MAKLPRFSNNLINPNVQVTAPMNSITVNTNQGYAEQAIALANLGSSVTNAVVQLAKQARDTERAEAQAYLAELTTEDLTQTDRIYQNAKSKFLSPNEFSQNLGNYQANRLKNIPENLRAEYKLQSDRRNAIASVNYGKEFLKQAKVKAEKKLYTSQKLLEQQLLSNPDVVTEIESEQKTEYLKQYDQILNSRVESGAITLEEKQLHKHNFNVQLTTATYKRKLEDQTPEQRAKTILDLQTAKYPPKSLTFDDKNKLISSLVTHNNLLKNVESEVYSETQSVQRVKQAIDSGILLDHKNKQDKTDVEITYQTTIVPELDKIVDPALKLSMIVDFVNKTNVIPQDLMSEMRAGLSTNSVQNNVYYSDLFGRLSESNPQIIQQFSKSDVNKAQLIYKGISAGGDPEQVIEQVRDRLVKVQQGKYKTLEEDYKNKIKGKGKDIELDGKKVTKIINNLFDTTPFFPFFDPSIQSGKEAAAIDDYLERYKSWYTSNGGDANLAKQNADKDFKNIWGVTDIHGSKEITKYPLNYAYPYIDEKKYRSSLTTDLKKNEKYKNITTDDVFLQWDLQTAREWNTEPPSYKIFIKDKDGNLAPIVTKNGVYLRARPDITKWRRKHKDKLKQDAEQEQEKQALLEKHRSNYDEIIVASFVR